MISIQVVFLGPSKDFAGVDSVSFDVAEGSSVADLRGLLAERYKGLSSALPTIRFAVNQAFALDERMLVAGDEVALIPPVSGGAKEREVLVDLVTDPISVGRVRDFVSGDPELGAIVTFEGATRREVDPEHGPLARLEYESYNKMAVGQLERLANEALERWSAGRIAIVHRLGAVPPGELSVIIAVACGHRAEAFAACRWLIDTLKKDVPIWKKDVFEDGYVRWVRAEGGRMKAEG